MKTNSRKKNNSRQHSVEQFLGILQLIADPKQTFIDFSTPTLFRSHGNQSAIEALRIQLSTLHWKDQKSQILCTIQNFIESYCTRSQQAIGPLEWGTISLTFFQNCNLRQSEPSFRSTKKYFVDNLKSFLIMDCTEKSEFNLLLITFIRALIHYQHKEVAAAIHNYFWLANKTSASQQEKNPKINGHLGVIFGGVFLYGLELDGKLNTTLADKKINETDLLFIANKEIAFINLFFASTLENDFFKNPYSEEIYANTFFPLEWLEWIEKDIKETSVKNSFLKRILPSSSTSSSSPLSSNQKNSSSRLTPPLTKDPHIRLTPPSPSFLATFKNNPQKRKEKERPMSEIGTSTTTPRPGAAAPRKL